MERQQQQQQQCERGHHRKDQCNNNHTTEPHIYIQRHEGFLGVKTRKLPSAPPRELLQSLLLCSNEQPKKKDTSVSTFATVACSERTEASGAFDDERPDEGRWTREQEATWLEFGKEMNVWIPLLNRGHGPFTVLEILVVSAVTILLAGGPYLGVILPKQTALLFYLCVLPAVHTLGTLSVWAWNRRVDARIARVCDDFFPRFQTLGHGVEYHTLHTASYVFLCGAGRCCWHSTAHGSELTAIVRMNKRRKRKMVRGIFTYPSRVLVFPTDYSTAPIVPLDNSNNNDDNNNNNDHPEDIFESNPNVTEREHREKVTCRVRDSFLGHAALRKTHNDDGESIASSSSKRGRRERNTHRLSVEAMDVEYDNVEIVVETPPSIIMNTLSNIRMMRLPNRHSTSDVEFDLPMHLRSEKNDDETRHSWSRNSNHDLNSESGGSRSSWKDDYSNVEEDDLKSVESSRIRIPRRNRKSNTVEEGEQLQGIFLSPVL